MVGQGHVPAALPPWKDPVPILHGSFQKFCTLYVISLEMNLFYKIHLQAFNVISIVLYHSGPTFGQVLYSCQDAFVVDASDYSGHLIRHFLSASEAFPTEWFLQFWEQVKVWWAHVRTVGGWESTCHPYFSKISDTARETCGRASSCKMRTPAANMSDHFWRIFGGKTFCRNFLYYALVTVDPGGTPSVAITPFLS